MATVYRDKRMRNAAGRPAFILNYRGVDGRRHRERTDATTREEAEAILRERLREHVRAAGLGLRSLDHLRPIPFREFFEKEYMPLAASRNRPATYARKKLLAKHLLPVFGPMPLRAIGAGHVEKYMEQRSKADPRPSPAEINRERALLSNALAVAFRRGLVDSNPVSRVQPLREDNRRDLWLTREEVGLILEHAEAWVKPFILLAVHTGMRSSEICGLRWADLEASPGFIRVGIETSKSHKPRYIPLNSEAAAVLQGQSPFIGPEGKSPFVFMNTLRKNPYRPNSVYHDFKAAAERAARALEGEGKPGADRLRAAAFHTLRHTFASWLIQAGIPIAEVQQYLGHSSDTMTRRYAHLAPATGRRNALEVLVTGQNPARNGVRVAKEVAAEGRAL